MTIKLLTRARKGVRKTKSAAILVFLEVLSCASFASAHPGSALVIDQQTNVYFAYWGGTWKLDLTGKLTQHSLE
jgi:hypothetical protein